MIDNLWNKFISIENLKLAWNKVMSNMGSPGIDKFTINDFQINIDDNLNILRKLLEDQNYEPLPLLKITIPKENQKERNILISTVRDRIVQTAILNILEPIFEKNFLDTSYSYRKGRSANMALNKIQKYIKNENNWIVIGDIESFFDNVNLEILFNLIKKEINDKNLLNLIFKIIKSGEQFNNKGIPQGSVISPIFANIYLNEFDKLIYSKYNLIRYVDDFL